MSELRLYCCPLAEGLVVLAKEESHHAITVLRVKPGHDLVLLDGAGHEAVGVVQSVRGGRLAVEVIELRGRPFDVSRRLTLAVAMPRAHRQGYLIEKCTELGVAAIWPIVTDHSVIRPKPTAVARWVRRAGEASKQSRRAWIPEITAPLSVRQVFDRVGEFDAVGWADVDAAAMGLTTLLERVPEDGSIMVAVGPEGGWSDAERELALEVGAVSVTLSPTVLRTETAAVAVCAAVATCSRNRDTTVD